MIPKIIHYCWFGKGETPAIVKMCIDSWRKYCPDYEIKRWDEDNSPMDIPWIRDAYRHQKYAFVADYVRFYALYSEGGIYMDTDMLLVKPLDDFLMDKAFLGRESAQFASMGIIGTKKGDDCAKNVLDIYNATHFDLMKPLAIPRLVTPQLVQYGLVVENTTQYLTNGWVVYQSDYFYPIPFEQEFALTDVLSYAKQNTYGIHLWNYSWSDEFDLLLDGKLKQGMHLVWKRFLRTPFLPFNYWKKVVKSLYKFYRR